jgi:ABC-type nitrate/sulfonate/bicarbonate transport system permease component
MAPARVSARRETALIRLLTVAGLLALWEALGQTGLVFGEALPPASAVGSAIALEIVSPAFYRHLAVTLGEVAGGFLFGAIPGLAFGLAMGARRVLGAAADPYIAALATTPKIVFLPIVMLAVGIGPGSKVALGAISAFFPVAIAAVAGMRAIPPVFVRVGRAFNLRTEQMVRMIYLPALALPIVTGLRLGLGVCIIGVLLGELKLASAGLGFLARDYYDQYDFAALYAIVAIVFALASLANGAMSRLARRAEAHR